MTFRITKDYNPHTDQDWYYVERKRLFWWERISGAFYLESSARALLNRLERHGVKLITSTVRAEHGNT
jgi:hypothetical protein